MQKSPFHEARQRGVALIAVLWLSVFLGLIAAAASNLSRSNVSLAINSRAALEARLAVDSAIDVAVFTLLNGDLDPWHTDGTPYGWMVGDTEVRVSISDENGRVDLNTATEDALTDLFSALGFEEEEAAVRADAVVDYREKAKSAVSLSTAATDAELRRAGYFAFGLVEEVKSVVTLDQSADLMLEKLSTVYTGLPAPTERTVRLFAAGTVPEDYKPTEFPTPIYPLADPPPKSSVLRLQAEARTRTGAMFAREIVIALESENPNRPFSLRLSRRSEHVHFRMEE